MKSRFLINVSRGDEWLKAPLESVYGKPYRGSNPFPPFSTLFEIKD